MALLNRSALCLMVAACTCVLVACAGANLAPIAQPPGATQPTALPAAVLPLPTSPSPESGATHAAPPVSTPAAGVPAAVLPSQTPPGPQPGATRASPDIIITRWPEEYRIYQDYLGVIQGKPARADTALIEGAVVSLWPAVKCPYPDETCRIDPYPSDWGAVKVERILRYAPWSAGSASGLREGQTVDTLFVDTSAPVVIRYVPAAQTAPRGTAGPLDSNTEGNAAAATSPGRAAYKPLPKEGGRYVLTTQIGNYPQVIQKELPGLEPGSVIRAEIQYAGGILYVGEYEKIR